MKPTLSMTSMSTIITFICLLQNVSCFIWKLNDDISPSKTLTFSERYMFATNHGPEFLVQGDSYIETDAKVVMYMSKNLSYPVAYAVFASSESHHHDALKEMCYGQNSYIGENNDWASDIHARLFPRSNFIGTAKHTKISRTGMSYDVTLYIWSTPIRGKIFISQEGWRSIGFQMCSVTTDELYESKHVINRDIKEINLHHIQEQHVFKQLQQNDDANSNNENDDGDVEWATLSGEVIFRNPYGYIPAEMYGFLPFEFARMISYIILGFVLIYYYIRYQESLIALHTAMLIVYIIAFTEAVLWYASYQRINITGQPYCCPFPTFVVGSLILQIFRQTFSRTLLLVVALGYGIVRPKLLPSEWLSVFTICVLYFTAATVAQVSEIMITHDVHGGDSTSGSTAVYQIPALFMDVIFLSWIFLALNSTQRILSEFRQTYKLSMYTRLTAAITMFATLFAMVTLFSLLDKYNYVKWPWQWSWLQQILWETLNFAVLASSCIICLPSETSQLLSYASQLPTEDPDEYGGNNNDDNMHDYDDDGEYDDGEVENGGENGVSAEDSEDFDFDGTGYEMTKKFSKNTSGSNGNGSGSGNNKSTMGGGNTWTNVNSGSSGSSSGTTKQISQKKQSQSESVGAVNMSASGDIDGEYGLVSADDL